MLSFKVQNNAAEIAKALTRIKKTLPYSLKKEMVWLMRDYRKKIIRKIRDGGYGLANNAVYKKWKLSRTNLHRKRGRALISTGNFFKSYQVKRMKGNKRTIIKLKLGPKGGSRKSAVPMSGPRGGVLGKGAAKFKRSGNIQIAKLLANSEFSHLYKEVKNIKIRVIRRILKILNRKVKREFAKIKFVEPIK